MRRWLSLLVGILLLLGLASPSTQAGYGLTWEFAPGAMLQGYSPRVETGWHTSSTSLDLTPYLPGDPESPNATHATDITSSDRSIFLRGWSVASMEAELTYVTVSSQLSPAGCTRTRVDLYYGMFYDTRDPAMYGGSMLYTHVTKFSTVPSGMWLTGSPSGYWNNKYLGEMMASENQTCIDNGYWSGVHLHQQQESKDMYNNVATGTWQRNSRYPLDNDYKLCPFNTSCGHAKNDDRTQWTHKLSW